MPLPLQLEWCRRNAPDALKGLPDSELWDLMKDAYKAYHNGDNPVRVRKDITYKEFLDELCADVAEFVCTSDTEFFNSLDADGYNEYRYTQSTDICNKWKQKDHRPDEGMPTSNAGWTIYVESKDCYFDINVTNIGNGNYSVEVARQPKKVRIEFV